MNEKMDQITVGIQNLNEKTDRMEVDIQNMDEKTDRMEADIQNLNEKTDRMETDIRNLDEKFDRKFNQVMAILENDVCKKIQILIEGFESMNRRIDEAMKMKEEHKKLEFRVSVVEYEVKGIKSKLQQA